MDMHFQERRVTEEIQTFKMRIGDAWCMASESEWLETRNPVTGRVWSRIPRGTAADVDAAVAAARTAFKDGEWSRLTASARGRMLTKLGDLIARDARKLAELEVRDNGKLFAEMLTQMRYLPQWLYYYGGLADKVEGAVPPIDKPDMLNYVVYEPLGVVAAIAPWNSPLLLAMWKIAPALAAGNTVVLKPSEYSSSSAIALAELAEEAGLPPGVLNVVTGFGREVGVPLVRHPDVAKVAFTGSDVAGRHVYESAARGLKRVALELGGKSANIIFEDADLDIAIQGVISGVFAAAGQTCTAGSRLLVQRSVHDKVVDRLVSFMRDAQLGDPMLPQTHIGPVSNEPQFNKVLEYIGIANAEGARCVLGGTRSIRPGCENGWFVEPTIFTGVDNSMRIAREEVFGPVLAVIPFDDEEDAVRIANDSPYGLAAGVWTTSIRRAMRMPKLLHVGTVWINTYRMVSYLAPFGGVKASGLGRENGIRAVHEYLEAKSVFISSGEAVEHAFVIR
jgi:aldehyde dehydrogenase (NAD+)